MMKNLIASLVLIMTGVANATDLNLPSDHNMVEFYSGKEINDLTFRIDYPSGPIEVIRDGRVGSQTAKQGDCMALIYSSLKGITLVQMQHLADALVVQTGMVDPISELKPQIRKGTVIFQLANTWFYMSTVRIHTMDGKSFTENKNRVMGINENENVLIRYLPHCQELED